MSSYESQIVRRVARKVVWYIRAVSSISVLCWVLGSPALSEIPQPVSPQLFAGGVIGMSDLLKAENSELFRSHNGGLYLHTNGWATLTTEQRARILEIFVGRKIAIELGFGSGLAWGELYLRLYGIYNLAPTFIAVNAFAHNNVPTVSDWIAYTAQLRAHGVPNSTLILPTFEYQNFAKNISMLSRTKVSESETFQKLIVAGGGLLLDTPSGYAMRREQAYRDWVVDAISWTNRHNLASVVILSPGDSGVGWAKYSIEYVQYLRANNVIPKWFVCENYFPSAGSDYPNRVGNDTNPNSTLGNCEAVRRDTAQVSLKHR